MRTLRFEGHADDTFGEYAVTEDDYDNCANGKPIRWKVESDEGGFIVTGHYSPNGSECWSISVEPIDEDKFPEWSIRIGRSEDTEYSPALFMDCPYGVTVTCLERTNQCDS